MTWHFLLGCRLAFAMFRTHPPARHQTIPSRYVHAHHARFSTSPRHSRRAHGQCHGEATAHATRHQGLSRVGEVGSAVPQQCAPLSHPSRSHTALYRLSHHHMSRCSGCRSSRCAVIVASHVGMGSRDSTAPPSVETWDKQTGADAQPNMRRRGHAWPCHPDQMPFARQPKHMAA